ncbi:CAP domain-containing protein [Aquibacillus saliphilus]|uniref:CAP domain-containing protein n=1 Tax=Aquibacillus saliphilus TaxID=1909422 RepID=UPI001CF0CF34|nr:CAP domain-containing protein [Aquibacillus saliphilus]
MLRLSFAILIASILFLSACNTTNQGMNDQQDEGLTEQNSNDFNADPIIFSPNSPGGQQDNVTNRTEQNRFNFMTRSEQGQISLQGPNRGQQNTQQDTEQNKQQNTQGNDGIRTSPPEDNTENNTGDTNAADNNAGANDGEISEVEKEVVRLTNEQRQQNGLSNLSADTELTNVAQKKSDDMAANNYFSHTSPTYGSPFDMLKEFGIDYTTAAENIASGQQSAEEVVNGWMNSPGHKKNILNKDVTHIGVGHATNGNYWTQLFIKK